MAEWGGILPFNLLRTIDAHAPRADIPTPFATQASFRLIHNGFVSPLGHAALLDLFGVSALRGDHIFNDVILSRLKAMSRVGGALALVFASGAVQFFLWRRHRMAIGRHKMAIGRRRMAIDLLIGDRRRLRAAAPSASHVCKEVIFSSLAGKGRELLAVGRRWLCLLGYRPRTTIEPLKSRRRRLVWHAARQHKGEKQSPAKISAHPHHFRQRR
jgi:hypothetical protein